MTNKAKVFSISISTLISALLVSPVFATIIRVPQDQSTIAAFDVGSDRALAILDSMGIPYTSITPSQLDTVDLSRFSLLYVGSTFLDGAVSVPAQMALDSLNAYKTKIRTFVENGGGLVALSEPIGNGRWEWAPVIVVSSSYGYIGYDDIVITNPSHPVMADLESSSLSGWNSSGHNTFIASGNLEIIATRNLGEPVYCPT